MASPSSRKRSPIWDYFTVAEDTKFAVCKTCDKSVSRGGNSTKVYTTSNLVNHLKSLHKELHKGYDDKHEKYLEEERTKKPSSSKQQTLFELEDKLRQWDINDVRAQRIHRLVAEMIALDTQPFSVVEDVGFVRLVKTLEPRYTLPSRKYLVEKILPTVHRDLMSKVREKIEKVIYFSFTTDAWSASAGTASLLSLTAHWLMDDFTRQSAVLHVQPLDDSHTGEYLGGVYKEMLEGWGISEEQVHLVLRDNAANMAKAMREASLRSFGCFAHSLQLVVDDGVLSQQAVIDLLAICRKMVGHFKHSAVAYDRLKSIQDRLGIPQHRLQQDVRTRWNSSLYMVKSISEQKMALAAYCTDSDLPALTTKQLELAEKIIAALSPIDEITKSVSSSSASISVIIPFVKMLDKTLKKHHDDLGVRTMKNAMLASLSRRFKDVEQNVPLVIACLLDPRFKDRFFSSVSKQAEARKILIEEMEQEKARQVESDTDAAHEPPSKRANRETTELWQSFNEILEESGASAEGLSSDNSVLEQYLSEPLLEFHSSNCLTWWKSNKARFPLLAKLAQRFLAPPPTSVPSERVFSGASDIYDEKRSRLNPEKAEILLFIKNNFSLATT